MTFNSSLSLWWIGLLEELMRVQYVTAPVFTHTQALYKPRPGQARQLWLASALNGP